MSKKLSLVFIAAVLLTCTGYPHAAGCGIQEQNVKAAALGGAFVARADDISAIYYNPAGIVFLKGVGFKINFTYNTQTTTASSEGIMAPIKSSSNQPLGSLYFVLPLTGKISFGIGAFIPSWIETNWKLNWIGSTQCHSSKSIVYNIRPAFAYKINNRLSFGAGLDIVFSEVKWSHDIIFSLPQYNEEENIRSILNTSGNGFGFSAGVLYKLSDNFRVGCTYKHRVEINLKGDNNFLLPRDFERTFLPSPLGQPVLKEEIISDFFKSQKVTSALTIPPEVVFGFMFAPIKKFTLNVDLQWIGRSANKLWEFASKNSDETLNPEFVEKYGDFYGISPDYSNQGINLNWKNTWNLKIGCEYSLNDVFALRAGFANLQSSVENNSLNPAYPDLSRKIFSFGAGYDGPFLSPIDWREIGRVSFGAFVQYVKSDKTSSLLDGNPIFYGGNFWILGAGVGFTF